MPYMIGKTEEVSKGLLAYHCGSSFENVANLFGRNAMYWYRAFCSLGRNSIVGTTVKDISKLPVHLVSDEKHSKWQRDKVYLTSTVAKGCILGAPISLTADEKGLEAAYGEFIKEAKELNPDYLPISVNTDGWKSTRKVWSKLCPSIVLVLCFFHSAKKIQDVSKRLESKNDLMKRVWDCYKAKSFAGLAQNLRRLKEWSVKEKLPEKVMDKVNELYEKRKQFKAGIEIEGAHRTSNMVDRLMDYQDRALYRSKYFHSLDLDNSAKLFVRAMALIWNFHPYCKRIKRHSPFEDINGFIYQKNWLENMMIANSGGYRHNISNVIR